MKIYTKTGDKGNTSLYDGSKVSKDNIIIDCIGDIDELNAEIGSIISFLKNVLEEHKIKLLLEIQSQLFDMGALIAYPNNPGKKKLDFDNDQKYTKILEEEIDYMTNQLPKLVNFILPGGSIEMSIIHKARTVCRRAERKLVALKTNDVNIQDACYIYINRLSDFLFTLARYIGYKQEVPEVIYKKNR
jgi:cob(I)alamin adenosyltransferase